jgi:protein-S-isoprenylcysteine O-methyltransferase Ste14
MNARTPRPPSAVSTGVGMAGLVGMAVWILFALTFESNPLRFVIADLAGRPDLSRNALLSGPYAALCNVAACGIPMVLWSVLVDKVHRNPTTGLDWDARPRPWREMLDVTLTKLAGLWFTWGVIACVYFLGRFYWQGNYVFAMQMFAAAAVPLLVVSVPYVLWLDTRLKEPRDGAWHMGSWLMGQGGWDRAEIARHLRAWAVKGFFLAFMVSIVPPGYRAMIEADFGLIQRDPVALAHWLITLMFVIDVGFATVGYMLTLKPLDAHIRSATPYAAGWVAALICYPPFLLMNAGGPLDYRHDENAWVYWLQGHPAALAAVGAVLVGLTAIYAWATVAFGLRFSNLTDRGILTHGPYAWTKHPAYLSKNAFWWISAMPFLVASGSVTDAIRNTALLAIVSGVYYWRAKTEEWHLGADPDYRAYADWMAANGPITRWLRWPGLRRAAGQKLSSS